MHGMVEKSTRWTLVPITLSPDELCSIDIVPIDDLKDVEYVNDMARITNFDHNYLLADILLLIFVF